MEFHYKIKKKKVRIETLIPYIVLFSIVVIIGILRPETISLYYLGIKADMVLPLIFLAAGQTIVLISGGFDLSVGGIMSLSTCLIAAQIGNIALMSFIVLLIGAIAGFANGFLISKLKLQPFITTLGTWTVLGGVSLLILKTDGGIVPETFMQFFIARFAGIPISIIIIAAVIVLWYFIKNSAFGYAIFSIGSSEQAAYYNGININKTKIFVYTISGFFAALSGLAYCGIVGTGSPTVGNSNILMSVAAAVIGGTSLMGGKGGIAGTIVGVFILKLISDVLVFAGVTSYWTPLFQGILLIVSVSIGSVSMIIKEKKVVGI